MGFWSTWRRACLFMLLLSVAMALDPWPSSAEDRSAEARAAEPRPVVKLTTLDWPPYCGPSLPDGGYVCKAVRLAAAKAGYAVEIEFLPWNRAVEAVLLGEADGYFPEYPSDLDPGKYLYAGPLPAAPLVFASLAGKTHAWPPLDGLKGAVIGVVRGYRNTEEFDARADLNKDYSDTDRQNLEKLLAGRTDLIVIDWAVCNFLLGEMGEGQRGRVTSLSPVLDEKTLVVAFGRNNPWSPELSRALGKAFQEMKETGELERMAAIAGIIRPRP